MLRRNLNLSSFPFVNNRKFYLVSSFLLGVLVVVSYWNAGQYLKVHSRKMEMDRVLEDARQRIDKLEGEERQIRNRLLRPETADFLETVEFVNQLIDRRTFSWTQLLNDLEQVVPRNVQVVSVRPRIVRDEFGVEITANARSSEDYVGFLANLETSRKFGGVVPIFEDLSKTPGFVGKQVSVAVKYRAKS